MTNIKFSLNSQYKLFIIDLCNINIYELQYTEITSFMLGLFSMYSVFRCYTAILVQINRQSFKRETRNNFDPMGNKKILSTCQL